MSRRPVEVEEREFLVELGIVTETQSNLGLVALQSFEVYQLMFEDYPHKFSHYMEVLEQRYFMELVGNMKAEKQKLAKQVRIFFLYSLFAVYMMMLLLSVHNQAI